MIEIRRLMTGDAESLAAFYNGLSMASRRTFRPLGEKTAVDRCEEVVCGNQPEIDEKFDLVAVHENVIIGWSFIWKLDSDEPVFGLGVADACHGQGIGSALMDRVMEEARRRNLPRVLLTVVQDNEVAWRMYEKRGFVRYGEFVGEDGLPYFRMAVTLCTKGE